MPSAYDDDDRYHDAVDERGLLRDRKAIRVGLMMADAARAPNVHLHDGYGGPVGGKPGFIISDAGQATRDEAYRLSVRELTTAWQRSTGDAARSAEIKPMSAADAVRTDMRTLLARLSDARHSAYEAYVHELTNAWRS